MKRRVSRLLKVLWWSIAMGFFVLSAEAADSGETWLASAPSRIDKIRKTSVILRVFDSSGRPIPRVVVWLVKNTWWTRLSLETDERGECRFDGFLGD